LLVIVRIALVKRVPLWELAQKCPTRSSTTTGVAFPSPPVSATLPTRPRSLSSPAAVLHRVIASAAATLGMSSAPATWCAPFCRGTHKVARDRCCHLPGTFDHVDRARTLRVASAQPLARRSTGAVRPIVCLRFSTPHSASTVPPRRRRLTSACAGHWQPAHRQHQPLGDSARAAFAGRHRPCRMRLIDR
jgi:hypothetical protein